MQKKHKNKIVKKFPFTWITMMTTRCRMKVVEVALVMLRDYFAYDICIFLMIVVVVVIVVGGGLATAALVVVVVGQWLTQL